MKEGEEVKIVGRTDTSVTKANQLQTFEFQKTWTGEQNQLKRAEIGPTVFKYNNNKPLCWI
jgi:hypothetical protein